ncbi:hypothetical protein OX89_02545 [Diaphorobacter sp. J5-51]|nr:hypothetical protein OX89_02545 [Diaphorobacter sp. J5-51]
MVTLLEDENARTCVYFICQAEDAEHAREQAMDMYPQGKITNILKSPKPGDTVWWNDPDEDMASGHYQVSVVDSDSGDIEYPGTMVLIKNRHGSTAEVPASELEEEHDVEHLANDVRDSESSDGCGGDYTIVKRSCLIALLDQLQVAKLSQKANALAATQQALSQSMEYAEKLAGFVQHVAALNLWGYDKDDGNPYQECEDPDEGHSDSHNCLMELIEQARRL